MGKKYNSIPIHLNLNYLIGIKSGIDVLIECFFTSTTFANVSDDDRLKIEPLLRFSTEIGEKIYEAAKSVSHIDEYFINETEH